MTGKLPKPREDAPSYKEWKSTNHLVMTSLLNLLEPKVVQGFYFAEVDIKIWKKAKDLCNEKNDLVCIFPCGINLII